MLLQSGGGTWGTTLYAVTGVGSESRNIEDWTQTSLYAEDRGPQVPVTLEHPQCGFAAPGLILRQRFQIGVFRPIRVDHTNCLQVDIKTHSFKESTLLTYTGLIGGLERRKIETRFIINR
jgi:hypothetical protein